MEPEAVPDLSEEKVVVRTGDDCQWVRSGYTVLFSVSGEFLGFYVYDSKVKMVRVCFEHLFNDDQDVWVPTPERAHQILVDR